MEILNELPSKQSLLSDYAEPCSHYRSGEAKDNLWHSSFLQAMEPQMARTLPVGAWNQANTLTSLKHDNVGWEIGHHSLLDEEMAFSTDAQSSCTSSLTKLSKVGWILPTSDVSHHGCYLLSSHSSNSEHMEDYMLQSCSPVQSYVEERVDPHSNDDHMLQRSSPVQRFGNELVRPLSDHVLQSSSPVQRSGTDLVYSQSDEDNVLQSHGDDLVLPNSNPKLNPTASTHTFGDGSPSVEVVGSAKGSWPDHVMEIMFEETEPPDVTFGSLDTWFPEAKELPFACPLTPPQDVTYTLCSGDSPHCLTDDRTPQEGRKKMELTQSAMVKGLGTVNHAGVWESLKKLEGLEEMFTPNHPITETVDKSLDNIAPQTPGPFTFNGIHVRQDAARAFGLNPILGSPLSVGRSETDYSEICLVHLLIAGAEAVATRDMDLASVILVRLRELVSYSGSTLRRVAAYFTDGLQSRVEGQHAVDWVGYGRWYGDLLAAFQILHEISPYIKFGHFTANQAILEAVEGEKSVHIVDFEIMEGIQWPPFMQALVLTKGGPPQLRITALCRPHTDQGVEETGNRLSDFASSLNLPFSFHIVRISKEEFSASSIKAMKGEALVVNCMLHLPHMPHRTATSVSSFLQAVRRLSPTVLTLVEEELGCSRKAVASYFSEALHHYSAIGDSLEACLAEERVARMLVERVFLAPRIISTVMSWSGKLSSSAHSVVAMEAATYNWCFLVRQAGFKSLPLSSHNLTQAKLLLGLYKDGFKLKERSNRLLLEWRTKPLFAASVWN